MFHVLCLLSRIRYSHFSLCLRAFAFRGGMAGKRAGARSNYYHYGTTTAAAAGTTVAAAIWSGLRGAANYDNNSMKFMFLQQKGLQLLQLLCQSE